MSDCCSASCNPKPFPKKHRCPANGKEYASVSSTTIKHHIKEPWLWNAKDQGYFFCSDPDCSVVYFGQDNSVIEKAAVRTEVGVKEKSENGLVCYCYGVTKSEAKNNPQTRQFVIKETRQQQCACETRNPSGKCCLADFSRQ
ncbi:putative iron-sulfur cluster-binding metallochaperone [Kistimonas scapharcae]|uniref:putative iron-sulfur cluster-binding metallochaperone n=1 Tax=Kistimonas scapharcae TaxID=1036133 RepID=UPI003CD0C41E